MQFYALTHIEQINKCIKNDIKYIVKKHYKMHSKLKYTIKYTNIRSNGNKKQFRFKNKTETAEQQHVCP